MSKKGNMDRYLGDHHEFLRPTSERLLEVMRLLGGDITVSQLTIVIEVSRANAAGHPIDMKELEVSMGVSSGSTFSRHVASLLDQKSDGVPGLGLIEQRENPKDRRRKQLFLTTKGLRFRQQITDFIVETGGFGEALKSEAKGIAKAK